MKLHRLLGLTLFSSCIALTGCGNEQNKGQHEQKVTEAKASDPITKGSKVNIQHIDQKPNEAVVSKLTQMKYKQINGFLVAAHAYKNMGVNYYECSKIEAEKDTMNEWDKMIASQKTSTCQPLMEAGIAYLKSQGYNVTLADISDSRVVTHFRDVTNQAYHNRMAAKKAYYDQIIRAKTPEEKQRIQAEYDQVINENS